MLLPRSHSPLRVASATTTELFISEYIEGTSNNKAIEIYNDTGSPVDLAANGYNIQMFFNGSATAGLTINLTGTVASGDVFVVAQASANPIILAQSDQTNGSGWFNGDDAVVLRKGTTIIDSFGQVGVDPGTEWGTGLVSTADNTLGRMNTICAGDTNSTDAFDPGVEWNGFATDTFDGLGTHTATCGEPTPTPTATATPTATPTPEPTPTSTPAPTENIIINELDSDTPGADVAEFVEIFDGGTGNSSLNGMILVFYNGNGGVSYGTIDLSGRTTNAQGYFTVGNPGVPGVDLTFPDNILQNGGDGVAIFSATTGTFPNGTPVTTANLVDAIVYETNDTDEVSLLPLLNAGQGSVNESSTGAPDTVSNQRCQNGQGGQRNTANYLQRGATPGFANDCPATPVFKKIAEIQGNGATSPFSGVGVITEGIVTARKSNGFFLQEPDATVDADPNTSEGIFVFTSAAPASNVGDFVNVTGNATEFFNLTQISSTNASVIVVSSANTLPTPIVLTTTILDPTGSPFQLERFEGMRLSAAAVRSVAPTNDFGEIYTVLDGVARPFREPGIEATLPVPPDPTSGLVEPGIPIWDRNPERIMIDTDGLVGSTRLNVTSNVGLSDISGPLEFSFDEYKILPESTPVQTTPNMTAVAVPQPLAGEFTVAGYNIENFNNNPAQRQKAALHIRVNMRSPDVIGLIEIANLASLQALATQVNSDTVGAGDSDPQYQAYLIPAPQGGTQHVGFLVKASRIQVDSVTQERAGDTFINPITGLPELLHDRPPLVLHATVNPSTDPRPIIVVVNHLRSFIDVELVGGDGPRVRAKRKAQAEATAELLQDLQTSNASTPVISVGDYNAYQFSDGYTDPIATLKGMPTADEFIVVDASPDVVDPNFVNLTDTLPPIERYSFIFEGTPQALDHVLVNNAANSILQRYAITRSNPDFPAVAPFTDVTRPEANSDHDSPVAYFKFPARETTTSVTDVNVTYNVSGQNVLLTANVTAEINTVNEGTVTFTVTTLDGLAVIGTAGPAAVASGVATANFALPGSVLPQALRLEAEFSGGDTTLASTGVGTLTVTYAICPLYEETRAVNSGAAYPIKLQLCDVSGVNVSSSSVVVRAVSINLLSTPDTELEVIDAGNSNPDNNFRYDPSLPGYIFNLKTTGLSTGIYQLNFTAGDDPTIHSVQFKVK